MGALALEGSLFSGTWVIVGILGLLGSFALCLSRNLEGRLLALMSPAYLVLGSNALVEVLNLNEMTTIFNHLIFRRFGMLAKPFWYLAAGYALVRIFSIQRQKPDSGAGTESQVGELWKTLGRPILGSCVALIISPFATSNLNSLPDLVSPLRKYRPPVQRRTAELQEREAFLDWLKASEEDATDFFRIGINDKGNRLVEFGVLTEIPIFKMKSTPASEYKYRFSSTRPTALRAANVKYVLSPKNLPLKRADFRLAKRFSTFDVYDFMGWVGDPFEVTEGTGPVKMLKFTNREIVLRAGETAHGSLRLNVSEFPRWRAPSMTGTPWRFELPPSQE